MTDITKCGHCGKSLIDEDGCIRSTALVERWETEEDYENVQVLARLCEDCGDGLIRNLGS